MKEIGDAIGLLPTETVDDLNSAEAQLAEWLQELREAVETLFDPPTPQTFRVKTQRTIRESSHPHLTEQELEGYFRDHWKQIDDALVELTSSLPHYVRPRTIRWGRIAATIGAVLGTIGAIVVGIAQVAPWLDQQGIRLRGRPISETLTKPLQSQRVKKVAVTLFESDGDQGVAEAISSHVSALLFTSRRETRNARLELVGFERVGRFGSRPELADLHEVFGATHYVYGRIVKTGNDRRIVVILRDSHNETVDEWTYLAEGGNWVNVPGQCASDLLTALGFKPTPTERARLETRPSQRREALEAYATGRFALRQRTKFGFDIATTKFKEALEYEPRFADAYAGLADSYSLRAVYGHERPVVAFPLALAAAECAVRLAPSDPESRVSLGFVHANFCWDFERADLDYRAAIENAQSGATPHHWRALLLSARGDSTAALAEINRAIRLEPDSEIIQTTKGTIYYQAGHADRAAFVCEDILRTSPGFDRARLELARALEDLGNYDEAMRHVDELPRDSTTAAALRARLLFRLKRRTEGNAALDELLARWRDHYVSPYDLASVYAAMGKHQEAVTWLRKAIDERVTQVAYLRVDPVFKETRRSPEFLVLLEIVGRGPCPETAAVPPCAGLSDRTDL